MQMLNLELNPQKKLFEQQTELPSYFNLELFLHLKGIGVNSFHCDNMTSHFQCNGDKR